MELYFLRHGPAVRQEGWTDEEKLRPLSEEGVRLMKQEAGLLQRMGLKVDRIVTSPLTRAAQTAEIVARGLGLPGAPIEDERLAPGFGVDELGRILRSHSSAAAIMLVGHEPDFSGTIGRLIGRAAVEMKKGGLARLELEDPSVLRATLHWLIPPEVLLP